MEKAGKGQSHVGTRQRPKGCLLKIEPSGKGALDALAYPYGRPANTTHAKRAKDRRKRIPVSTGKVVAELTLYFWKRLYGPEYEQTLWRPTLKRTFPDKRIKRADIASNLENIYQARNRLAHHEPVLHKRFNDTISSLRYIIERLETKTRIRIRLFQNYSLMTYLM
ncbi:hypothetical protein E6W36_03225 [Hankyongella ginsenosidimutans]|uniref:Abi family protein n=1 Tax=Hankyongella ginsenosidimutans TaxID=1763828 RepID=A0A4D7C5L6_9SPHN|nr:hypothetical protein [Hankyongella ginsenosidimutans]QCI78960.1 hypothetical protein E6W36_03225 [Hankyongella ginsenosidimutans]